MEYQHKVGLTLDQFAHIAMTLIWQWQNGYLDSFAKLYTKCVADWGNRESEPADGVYLHEKRPHGAKRNSTAYRYYVVVDLPPRVVIDPSKKRKIDTTADLNRETLNGLIDALRRVYWRRYGWLYKA